MSVNIINSFKIINIKEYKRQLISVPLGFLTFTLQTFEKVPSVVAARKPITNSQFIYPLKQP